MTREEFNTSFRNGDEIVASLALLEMRYHLTGDWPAGMGPTGKCW